MCTVLLPPGVNPISVDKYIISLDKNKQQRKLVTTFVSYANPTQNSYVTDNYVLLRRATIPLPVGGRMNGLC